MTLAIRPRDRDAVIQALRTGVVPYKGLQHIQVGRKAEVEALLVDLASMHAGGSFIRFVIGTYGSGKTFFLQLVRSIALQKKMVTAFVDLTPARRFHGADGQARSLYQELIRNLSTLGKPEGGGLTDLVQRFVTMAKQEAEAQGQTIDERIRAKLALIRDLCGGYEFAEVLIAYWRGVDQERPQLCDAAIRWLRGEFSSRLDARKALGVGALITDAEIYDQLKIWAGFVREVGYMGLLVCLDEMVNLYKLQNAKARNTNYEHILHIVNDCLQNETPGIGVLFGGTPEFLSDPRKGLYGYPALESRLAENRFVSQGLIDTKGPVLRLPSLSQEDLLVLLDKIRNLYALGNPDSFLIPDEGIEAFFRHAAKNLGDACYRMPRKTVVSFIQLLDTLEQNRHVGWEDLIGQTVVDKDMDPHAVAEDDALSQFRL